MKFWDTSAVVPLLAEQPQSKECRDIFRADPEVVVSQVTRIEATSALTLLARTHPPLSEAHLQDALARLDRFARKWREVRTTSDEAINALVQRALRLLLEHRDLRAGDAVQLASAGMLFDPPSKRGFVVFDRGLAAAAQREGFTIFGAKVRRRS